MKHLLILVFISFFTFSFSQKDDHWYAFYNRDSTKIGFKDAQGNLKIEPKFQPFMTSQVFVDVIAVTEEPSPNISATYYLNKNGHTFGKDSVYIFDFEYAEMSDGKIKFKDYKNDKVGFFDANGKVVIPAMYNDTGDFHKGLAVIMKDAIRWCNDNNSSSAENCEHYGWRNGKNFMINDKNEILFEIPEQTDYSFTIDYSKFKVNEEVDKEIYTNYKGSDGNLYSFYSPEKDFEKWLNTIFMVDFKKNKTVLPKYFYDLISVDDNDNPKENTAWKNHFKKEYLQRNQKIVDEIFQNLLNKKLKNNISSEKDLNYLYFPENILPKEDLRGHLVISFMPRIETDYSGKNQFQFMKIGDGFLITSAP